MKTRKELKQDAKTALRGNWAWGIGVSLVPALVLEILALFLASVVGLVYTQAQSQDQMTGYTTVNNVVMVFLIMAFLSVGLFAFFGAVGIGAGAQFAYLDLIRGRKRPIKQAATYAFKDERFDSVFGVYFMSAVFTILWMILLIIPGYIKAVSYSQALFTLKDDLDQDKGITLTSNITKSRLLMKDHKMDYFKLILSFLGWFALVLLVTLPIYYVIVQQIEASSGWLAIIAWSILLSILIYLPASILAPYVGVTMAAFYEDLRQQDVPEVLTKFEEELALKQKDYRESLQAYNDKQAERRAQRSERLEEKSSRKWEAKEAREEKRREKVAKKQEEREAKRAKDPKAAKRAEKKEVRRQKAIEKLEAKQAKYKKSAPSKDTAGVKDKETAQTDASKEKSQDTKSLGSTTTKKPQTAKKKSKKKGKKRKK